MVFLKDVAYIIVLFLNCVIWYILLFVAMNCLLVLFILGFV